jgi:hypothetical protein
MHPGYIFLIVLAAVIALTGIAIGLYFAFVGATPNETPPAPPDVMDIRYYNDTGAPFTVWFEGSQPPCNKDQASKCNTWITKTSETPDAYAQKWADLADVFKASGTRYLIYNGKQTRQIPVSNSVVLQPGETLVIQPPMDENGNVSWYYMNRPGTAIETAGVKAWISRANVNMPASERVLLYEYNVAKNAETGKYNIYWDISAVDGINAKATMQYGDAVSVTNTNIDQCLYNGTHTCQNLKFEPEETFNKENVVAKNFYDIWVAAGSPYNKEMAMAASGDPVKKMAYHLYWATDPQAIAYLNWLQRDANGKIDTNAYGWAYDEKKWKPGVCFEANGNPAHDNKEVDALKVTPLVPGQSLEIHVTDLM